MTKFEEMQETLTALTRALETITDIIGSFEDRIHALETEREQNKGGE